MQLLFRLPFVLLETFLRQGVRGLASLFRVVRGGDADEAFSTTPPRPSSPDFGSGTATTDLAGFAAGRGTATQDDLTADDEAGVGGDEGFGADVEEPAPPPPPTAAEAIARREAREAEAVAAPPVQEPDEPAPVAGVEDEDHVDAEPTLVESFGPSSDVGAALQVDEPWDGYDGMPATAVVSRLRGADDATKAVVRLYEQTHKKRQTILRATG
jgi:hypothetical protein